MPLDLDADISGLKGAEYNPRFIGPEERAALKTSIETIGMVKPLIVRGDIIVAGHQRTNALRELGITRAPVYALERTTTVFDEIRFNQLSNGTDTDAGDENAYVPGGFDRLGFQVVDHRSVSGNHRGSHAVIRAELCQMLISFGPFGGCVATKSGKIIHAAQYALAASTTRTPLTVAVIPDEMEEVASGLLGRSYGQFSYDHLERKTYIQSMAQMFRLRETASGKQNKSVLYEGHVLPWLDKNPHARVLDFGSGFGDYAAALRGRGIDIHDVELFRRKTSSNDIDKRAVTKMIDKLVATLTESGRFDAIVLDAVMNSIDSLEAETAVLDVCNGLLLPGGRFFFSGRPRESVVKRLNYTKSVDNKARTYIEFLDANGFTARFRAGLWMYQRYHSKEQVEQVSEKHGFTIDTHARGFNSWQVEATKTESRSSEYVDAALKFEFDLLWGSSSRIGRADDVLLAAKIARRG